MAEKQFEAPSGVIRRFVDMGGGRHAEQVAAALVDAAGSAVSLSAPDFDWAAQTHYALTVDTSAAGNDLASLIDAASGGTATTLADAIAAGLSAIIVTVAGFPIRVRFDDGDPSTVGLLFGVNDEDHPWVWDAADFTKIKMIGVGGTATVNIALAI